MLTDKPDVTDGSGQPAAVRSWDPIWERLFRTQSWGKYPPEHVVRFVARSFYQAADRRQVKLLDLGAGPGAVSWYMAREGFAVSAIDGSHSAITQLRTRLAAEGLTVDARVGDCVGLPWGPSTFDGVIDNASMYANTFESCRQIVREVRRVLKPGGVFYSTSFTDRTWGCGLGTGHGPGEFTAIPEGPLHDRGFATFFGRAQLNTLFAEFEDVNTERISWTLEHETRLVEMWIVTCRTRS